MVTNKEQDNKGRVQFRYAMVAFCSIAAFLTYTNNLPRWLYFEHFLILVHTFFPMETEYIFYLAMFPFNLVYFLVRYMKTYKEHKQEINKYKRKT